MKRWIFIILGTLTLSACMRNVDTYNSDPYIVSTLAAYSGQKINVAEFESSMGEGGVNQCRGYSFINNPGEGGLVRYIQDAFVSELELANAYSPDSPIILKGKVTQISLSTLTVGEWIIKLTLMSNNGRSISAKEQLYFKTNIVGQSACQVAGDTFFYAVQNLLRKLVSSPNFPRLLEPSNYPKPKTAATQPPGIQRDMQPQATEMSPLETSTYTQPAVVEIIPLEVTTQTQPAAVQSTPIEVTVQPKGDISTSDCSIEKQIPRQSNE